MERIHYTTFKLGERVLVGLDSRGFTASISHIVGFRGKPYLIVKRDDDEKIYTIPASRCQPLSTNSPYEA